MKSSIRQRLPCYARGDLPPDAAREVERALAEDTELRRDLDALRNADVLARRGLLECAPVPSGGSGLFFGLVAALLLVVGLGLHRAPPPGLAESARLYRVATASPPGFIAETDRTALSRALVAQGVEPALAEVFDLSKGGLSLVGGMAVPGDRPGRLVVYRKGDDFYVCAVYPALDTSARPVAVRQVGDKLLRAFQGEGVGVVTWALNGRTCVFVGPGTARQVLAVVAASMGGARA